MTTFTDGSFGSRQLLLLGRRRSGGAGCGQAFDLLKVVDVVAGHGFYDGPEGHGAALGVGGAAVPVVLRDGGEEEQIPVARGLEEGQRGVGVGGLVTLRPGLLVAALHVVVWP